jgi:hypothetical protein
MTTALVGDPIGDAKDVTIPVVISGGAGGGALAATSIYKAGADMMKLDEVEVVAGSSTDTMTVKNSRGTSIFSKALPVANKIYGGHQGGNAIFPKMDCIWTVETNGFTALDTVTVYFKFTRFNG